MTDPQRLEVTKRRIANCRTYNFGMRDADLLAHEDAPWLVELVEKYARAIEVNANYWWQRENWWREQADKLMAERDEARQKQKGG